MTERETCCLEILDQQIIDLARELTIAPVGLDRDDRKAVFAYGDHLREVMRNLRAAVKARDELTGVGR